MTHRMILAGSGGQGCLTMGKLLAECAMAEGLHVTYFPSYGGEVRGGTAHCHVVLSTEQIFSPLVEQASALMIMNQPSLDRFAPQLQRNGLLIINSSMTALPKPLRSATVIEIPASDIARRLGDVRVANMVMLGALNRTLDLVRTDRILAALAQRLAGKAVALMPLNEQALAQGEALARPFAATDR